MTFTETSTWRVTGSKTMRFFCESPGPGSGRRSTTRGTLRVSSVRLSVPWRTLMFETTTRLIPLGARSSPLLDGAPIWPHLGVEEERIVRFEEGEFAIPSGEHLWAIRAEVEDGSADVTCWLEGDVVPVVEIP